MKMLLTLFLFLTSLPAYAGGWVSGGGNLVRNSNNPWFLANTKAVSYCLVVDESFNGLPAAPQELVEKALAYWKVQMSDPNGATDGYPISLDPNIPYVTMDIATQNFIFRKSCLGDEDITFQFGVLNQSQKDYFGDRSQLIAAAVRTDYDEVNLKGRGFIYITPDSGRNSYKGERLRSNAWHFGNSGLLYRALIHELGHVFGLSHGGDGLMSERYTESLLRDTTPAKYAESFELPAFFHFELSSFVTTEMLGSDISQGTDGVKLFGREFHFPLRANLEAVSDGHFRLRVDFLDGKGPQILGNLVGSTQLRVPGHGFGVTVVLMINKKCF